MQSIQVLLGQITLQSVLIYFGIGSLIWYISYGFEMYLNGGSLGRGRGWVLKCFWEEMLWFLPGGLSIRTDYIREMVKPQANSSGYIDGYSYDQIREQNLYESVAKSSLGNGFYFWGVNVILVFFLWPLHLAALAVLVALSGVMSIAATFIPALRG